MDRAARNDLLFSATEKMQLALQQIFLDAELRTGFNRAMQTLGLSDAPQPTDNLFKRLLWPEIANGYDVDLIGQQGFWVCFVVAALSMLVLIATGQLLLGIVVGATYFLGGMGVRQRSVAAAILIFAHAGSSGTGGGGNTESEER